MDLYLASAEPGLTLQEMIDFDIKGGIDFDVDPLMTSIDLSAMSALEADFTLRPFESLFDPLERPDEDEAMETGSSSEARPSPPAGDTSPIASWMNLSAMTNFNLDTETSLMVNPSVVLPSPHHPPVRGGKPSPPSRRPPSGDSPFSHAVSATTTTAISTATSTFTTLQTPIASSANPLAPTHSLAAARHLTSATTTTTSAHHKQQSSSNGVTLTTSSSAIPAYQSSRSASASFAPPRSKPLQKYRRDRTPEEKSYPKPAYSYACLIALALKNSMTGSLPVSEIYSFMCEHFPYFRTAPNGWKNSVRHNLSLNKCFEKIEKPVVSGSNQRKGCLWALNPLKAHKMDEEVQKWSKKDLPGIRDAMTCPDVLESLERGEMKFEASNGASSCSEDEEDEESLEEHSPIKFINATPVVIPQSLNSAPTRVVSQTGFRSSPKSGVQLQDLNMASNGLGSSSHQTSAQSGLRTNISSSSPEPDFMLPDSTMSEINIQSNGAVVDDFGNEISLDGDLSIMNPRASPATSAGGTNLILKKVSASPLRSSPVRSNFVYTANSPLVPHHHQNGLNRLVLTNAKLS